MKVSHIIGVIIIAVAIGIIVSTSGDASQYVSFKEAYQKASEDDHDKVHVVGRLKKDSLGSIYMNYNPTKDPNYFTFILVDKNQEEKKVVYYGSKPQDFEKSEQVVIVGNVKDNEFVASGILMKCPSKYENDKTKTLTSSAE